MKKCNYCNIEYGDYIMFCEECSGVLVEPHVNRNHCSNNDCKNHINNVLLREEQKYCGMCGSPTMNYKKIHDFL